MKKTGIILAVLAMFVAMPLLAAGAPENTPEEQQAIEDQVRSFAEKNIEDEQEREEFNRTVVGELSERLVDVQGLEIALRAFDLGDEEDGEEFAQYVLETVARTEDRLRRGESPHRVEQSVREEARTRGPEQATQAERGRERSEEVRERVQERAPRDTERGDEARESTPGAGRP
ncbi:MAG: hypothetical protein LC641_00540 [Spirochaeta sp.]|nr:hypothetical protein [Spirochaeta sp.]